MKNKTGINHSRVVKVVGTKIGESKAIGRSGQAYSQVPRKWRGGSITRTKTTKKESGCEQYIEEVIECEDADLCDLLDMAPAYFSSTMGEKISFVDMKNAKGNVPYRRRSCQERAGRLGRGGWRPADRADREVLSTELGQS